jgi:hypothetical protein
MELGGAATRAPESSSNRRDMVYDGDQHDNIGHIRGCQEWGRQRSPMPVRDQMMLRAGSPAIRGVRPGLSTTPLCRRLRRIDHRARPVELAGAVESYEKNLEYLIEDPCMLPLSQAIPAGHPAAPQLIGDVFPRDAGTQDKDDAREGDPVRRSWTPSPLALGVLRKNRLEDRPQFIIDEAVSHTSPGRGPCLTPVQPAWSAVFLGALR